MPRTFPPGHLSWLSLPSVLFFLTIVSGTPAVAGDSPASISNNAGVASGAALAPEAFLDRDLNIPALRKFFLELLTDAPRALAPGAWIDALPPLQPVLPDLRPLLEDDRLYGNPAQEAAASHWNAFVVRNPGTAAWLLRELGAPPTVSLFPGKEGTPTDIKFRTGLATKLYGDDRKEALGTLGEALLLADFLAARGGDPGKAAAFRILATMRLALTPEQLRRHVEDTGLGALVAEEMLWPLLDASKGRFDPGMVEAMRDTYRRKAGRTPRSLQMDKWLVLQPGCPPGLRQRIFDDRRQAYADAGDHLGVVLCVHAMKGRSAENAPDQHNDDSLGRIRGRLGDAFGKEVGPMKFHRYLDAMSEAPAVPGDAVRRTLLRLQADDFKTAKEFAQTITCLKKLDPDGKNPAIQKEIASLVPPPGKAP